MKRVGLLASILMLAMASAAHGGVPGTWTKVTGVGVNGVNTDEVGLARTDDGVLHIAWTRAPIGSYNDDLLHSEIGANGKTLAGPHTILSGFEFNNSADLLGVPGGGLRVFFAGLNPASPLDTLLATATSNADGNLWTVAPLPVSASNPGDNHPVYVASGIGGGLDAAGTPIGAWGDSSPGGGGYHVGLDPAVLDVGFPPACCDVGPDVALSTDGQLVLARVFLGDETSLIARLLPSGQELTAPGSGAAQVGDRVSISGRIGQSGVYVAYTSGTNPFTGYPTIWRVGASKAKRLSSKRGAEHTKLAAAPGGAFWVFWDHENRVYARRSNAKLSAWGATVAVRPPAGTQTVHDVTGDGSRGPLDLLALVERSGGQHAFWHRRILPGLSLSASPKKVSSSSGGKIKFTVTDAGKPIKGATVTLKGKKGTTNAKGRVKIKIAAGTKTGGHTAKASKSGYAKATARIRVKK